MTRLKIFLCIISLTTLTSCLTSKLAKISSDNTPLNGKNYVFENDTLKITYKFWSRKGQMGFDIYNKLDIPLFIDLKNSAFIPNDKMISYWQDITNTEGIFVESGYYFSPNAHGSGVVNSKSKSIHQERIMVALPHSVVSNNQYKLIKKTVELKTNADYSKNTSPLRFRNYLAFSTNEKFEGKIFYIDNSFYVSSVTTVDTRDVKSYLSDDYFYAQDE